MTRPTRPGIVRQLMTQRMGQEEPNPIADAPDPIDWAADEDTQVWVPAPTGDDILSQAASFLVGTATDASVIHDGDTGTYHNETNSNTCYLTVDFGLPVEVVAFNLWARGNQFTQSGVTLAVYGKATAFSGDSDTGDETLYSTSITLADDAAPFDEFTGSWAAATYRYWRVRLIMPGGQGAHFAELNLDGAFGFATDFSATRWTLGGPEATDADDATYLPAISGADVLIVHLPEARPIVRSALRIACATSGSRTYTLYGANEADFSDAVAFDSVTFTATGSYTAQDVEFSWVDAGAFAYFVLTGNSETRRIHTMELYEATVSTTLDEHLVSTDPHTQYQKESEKGAASGYASLDGSTKLPLTQLPAHATTHQSGGGDAIKLDDLATPDDNTDLDATTGHHGLLPKLPGGTTTFLRADGSFAAPSGSGALTVEEVDGSPTDSAVTKIVFPNGTLAIASHVATYTPAAGGGAITQAYVGYNTVGGTAFAAIQNRVYLKQVTLANDCLLTSIDVYMSDSSPSQVFSAPRVGVWTDNAGAYQNLIATNTDRGDSTFFGDTRARWLAVPLGVWLPAGTYWIGAQLTDDAGGSVRFYKDGSGSDKYGTPSGIWIGDTDHMGATSTTDKYSIRANTIR